MLGRSVIAVGVLLGGSGCASITGSELQTILVSTKAKSGTTVEKADCTLQSPRGLWKVTTPSSVTVVRSADDMDVNCQKTGEPTGLAKLISRAHGGMFGNIIFGGGIGALIDHNKGTGYDYPNKVTVILGETIIIDRQNETEEELGKKADAIPGSAAPALAADARN